MKRNVYMKRDRADEECIEQSITNRNEVALHTSNGHAIEVSYVWSPDGPCEAEGMLIHFGNAFFQLSLTDGRPTAHVSYVKKPCGSCGGPKVEYPIVHDFCDEVGRLHWEEK